MVGPRSASVLPPATLRQRSLAVLPRRVPLSSASWDIPSGRETAGDGSSTGGGKCSVTSCRRPSAQRVRLGVARDDDAPSPFCDRACPPRVSCPHSVSACLRQTPLFDRAGRPGVGTSGGTACEPAGCVLASAPCLRWWEKFRELELRGGREMRLGVLIGRGRRRGAEAWGVRTTRAGRVPVQGMQPDWRWTIATGEQLSRAGVL